MSDYFDCKSPGCKNPESYVCDHGTWILKTSVNNGVDDCADGSDEGIVGKYKYLEPNHSSSSGNINIKYVHTQIKGQFHFSIQDL